MATCKILIACIYVLNKLSESADVAGWDVLRSVLDELTTFKSHFEEREKFYEKKLTEVENKLYNNEERLKFAEQRLKSAEEEIIRLKSESNKDVGAKASTQKQEHSVAAANGSTAENFHMMDQVEMSASPDSPLTKRLVPTAGSHRTAFTAYLSSRPTGLGTQQTIPFDQVLLNEGDAFDKILHTFICPVNGIYVFQSALLCHENDMVQTDIVKDGAILVTMYARGTGTGVWDQGFNSAVVQCNKGERVWVRVHRHQGTTVYHERLSTFSGYLLWEL